jgi:hypothetical protein
VRLEEIDNLKKNQIPILASFLAQMLRNHSLPITILKVIFIYNFFKVIHVFNILLFVRMLTGEA